MIGCECFFFVFLVRRRGVCECEEKEGEEGEGGRK